MNQVHSQDSSMRRHERTGVPGRTLLGSLVLGLSLGCEPDSDSDSIRLEPREVTISARSPGVYLAELTTSFRPEDGPQGQQYVVFVSDIELVSMTAAEDLWLDDTFVWVTTTVLQPDGTDGEAHTNAWSVAELSGEGDTGETHPPHAYYAVQYGEAGSTPRQIDVRVEFETDSGVPLRFRWQPVGSVTFFRFGCIGTDGWVDLSVEPQEGTVDEVIEESEAGEGA